MSRNSKKIKIKRSSNESFNDRDKERRRHKKRFIKPPKLKRTLDKSFFSNFADEIPQILKLTHRESFIITAADSHIGHRNEQQDSYFVTNTIPLSPFRLRRTLAVVCDGMGGLEAGDRASLTAVSMLKLAFDKLPTTKVDIPKFFSEMIDYIDCEINRWDDLNTDKVVRQGKALYVGISRWPLEALKVAREYLAAHDVPLLIYQGRLNLLDRAPMEEGILEYCHKHGIGFISFSPLASGKLRDQYAEALNWILEQQGVTSVLVGVSKTEQLQKNIEALGL